MQFKLLATAALILFSQTAQSHSLFEAYQRSIQNDSSLMAAIKEFEAGSKNQDIGRASLLPQISAGYFQARNNQKITDTVSNSVLRDANNFPSKSFQVNLIQPIISLEAFAKYKQGLSQSEFSKKRFDFAKQDLATRLVQAYVDYHSAIDFNHSLEQQMIAINAQLKAIDLGRKNGETTLTEFLEVEASQLQVQSQLIEAESLIKQAALRLKVISGIDFTKIPKKKLSDQFNQLPLSPQSFDEWEKMALELNPEINAQRLQAEVSLQEYKKIHGGHFPKLDMVGNISRQESYSSTTFNQQVNQNYLGLQLSIPIFSGNEINSRAQQAYLIYEKELKLLEAIESKNLIEVKKEFDFLHFGSLKIKALKKSKDASREAVKATRMSIKSGFRSNLDLLLAEKNLAAIEKDLLLSQYNYLLSFVKLKLYAGQFNELDLKIIDGYFVGQ